MLKDFARIIILNYKRPKNVHKIVDVYKSLNVPITVINNNPKNTFPYLKAPVEVLNNKENYYCMERWIRCYEHPEPYKIIIDDDLLPSPPLILKLLRADEPLVGIYGKSGVEKASSYLDLTDHWCEESNVDFLVGSVLCVKQSALDKIKNKLEKIGYPKRGDDIIVSYLIRQRFDLPFLKTVSGKVLNLPEGDVALSNDPEHFNMRWNVIQKFKNTAW